MLHPFRHAALALTVPVVVALAPTASAFPSATLPSAPTVHGADGESWHHGERGRHRGWAHGRDRYQEDEPVYRGTRVWRGRDGRAYCRRSDGTTGLIVGAAAGALIGRGVAGDGDRTLGAILGGGAGALLGRQVERGGSRCR
ncbi:MAG: glycine zipper 2TM domain-containing protein [Pseudomonadota bacterium]